MKATGVLRKRLLYESRVEYGGWTINHVQGCAHGCRYPCYAMMLARRTGRVSSYEEWCSPRLVENALDLLDDELPRLVRTIKSVHLSFTTDPFMYEPSASAPRRDVLQLTMAIIKRLNDVGVRVTTLTKGVYPDELIDQAAHLDPRNQYGISLVSLSEDFRRTWEPGAADPEQRIGSLKRLAGSGHHTWLSVEPYPTPNIEGGSPRIDDLLASVPFVDKIIFGRWNYNKLANSDPRGEQHYRDCAARVADWSERLGKKLYIKTGTPLAHKYRLNVFAL